MKDIREQAINRWTGILSHFGLSALTLSGKHCPCPICDGKDRFRYDNKEGKGTSICARCGGRDGLQLALDMDGGDFKSVVAKIRSIMGEVSEVAPRPEVTEDERKAAMRKLWNASHAVRQGDAVHRYLCGRDIGFVANFEDIRTIDAIRMFDREVSVMLALARDEAGKVVTMHRTFIEDGAKAKMESPRMMLKGAVPAESIAVRLGGVRSHIGVAEGIETAAAAAKLFRLPVWATISDSWMAKLIPPAGVERITVFADNDSKFAGQAAGYALAKRLSARPKNLPEIAVDVELPGSVSTDWWDVMAATAKETA